MGFWPRHLPRSGPFAETAENFVRAFEWRGYKQCPDGTLVSGIEKVAIFLKNGKPTHAARQLETGLWASKCGELEDIQHPLAAIEGKEYGRAEIFLERNRGKVSQ
jgi:hypothetical protein